VARRRVDHAEHRVEHAAHGAHFAPVSIARRGHGVEVAEQLVGAVEQVTSTPYNRTLTMTGEARPSEVVRKMPLPQHAPKRREWLARAAFEGGLIALSLVAALALNEWKDARDRQARARDALAAMRLELEANREDLQRVIKGTAEVIGQIKLATREKRRYEDGLLRRAQLVSTAWDSSVPPRSRTTSRFRR
jgi:hypothetical protein